MKLRILAPVLLALTYELVSGYHSHSHSRTTSVSKPGMRTALNAFTQDELIAIAKKYTKGLKPEDLADDYVFRGPVIGPLSKGDILETLKGVAGDPVTIAFPDFESNAFGFTADDPIEPNRVWYFVRPRGTFNGPFQAAFGEVKPTGAKYIGPPEVRSMVINDEGKIKHATVGYVADRFTGDTTKGKGAVFGMYEVVGLSIDAAVGSPKTQFIQKVAAVLPGGLIPKSYSAEKDIPKWWTDKRRGAEA